MLNPKDDELDELDDEEAYDEDETDSSEDAFEGQKPKEYFL